MQLRTVAGIAAGIASFAAISWFSADVIYLFQDRASDISLFSHLVLTIFAILASIQIGALVASGHMLEDSTFPKEYSLFALVGLAIAFVLSILSMG